MVTSMASPSTVPTAAPVSIPPFMAEVITSTSASTRPMDTVPNSTSRDTAISRQAARIITDTLWRSSAVSVVQGRLSRASRKK